ncbi:hypothetical protein CDAR_167761 [Caerostris darwini]|uniref:Uncharacterized protein n=1 Tax=Caerostris darwini TaxID=1538125 RepID=A0AAV4MYJ1_9ARAC|nr:hypothetical protein CDAR_167761 [Caerostris darwini]
MASFMRPLIKLRPTAFACALHTFQTSLLSHFSKPFWSRTLLCFTMGHKRSRFLLRAFLAQQLTELTVTVGTIILREGGDRWSVARDARKSMVLEFKSGPGL